MEQFDYDKRVNAELDHIGVLKMNREAVLSELYCILKKHAKSSNNDNSNPLIRATQLIEKIDFIVNVEDLIQIRKDRQVLLTVPDFTILLAGIKTASLILEKDDNSTNRRLVQALISIKKHPAIKI